MASSFGADPTGAWLEFQDPGARKFISIGSLTLESGEILPDITIAYESWGCVRGSGRRPACAHTHQRAPGSRRHRLRR